MSTASKPTAAAMPPPLLPAPPSASPVAAAAERDERPGRRLRLDVFGKRPFLVLGLLPRHLTERECTPVNVTSSPWHETVANGSRKATTMPANSVAEPHRETSVLNMNRACTRHAVCASRPPRKKRIRAGLDLCRQLRAGRSGPRAHADGPRPPGGRSSFWRIRFACVSTVFGLRKSFPQVAWFERPSAINPSTSLSRGLQLASADLATRRPIGVRDHSRLDQAFRRPDIADGVGQVVDLEHAGRFEQVAEACRGLPGTGGARGGVR